MVSKVPIGDIRVGVEKGRQLRRPLLLWFKTFYEAVGLPKLNGVAINGYFLRASAPPSHQGSGCQPD
jgi:hypothetical protein